LARPSPLAAYYATARCAGGYVFTCGEIPRTSIGICATDQVTDVYEQLTSHLREHGASPSDIVHQTVFVRNSQDITVVRAAAGSICSSPLPTTLITAADMGFLPGVDVEIKLIAKLAE
jgi:enamine deaminase RidA (YjgF/YER057c/UK114 family)